VLGDLTGRSLLVFPTSTACRLAELMLRRPRGSSAGIGRLEQSALKECGNILCGAYLNALADFMQLTLLPSPPMLAIDTARSILNPAFLRGGARDSQVMCVESTFELRDEGSELRGFFLLLPDARSLTMLLGAIART
jgi:chemotaxis protein CheC